MAQKKFNSVDGFSVGSPGNVLDVIDNFANVYANRVFVQQYANLGSVGNITITGGSANYILITDGAGNLSWSSAAGIETATGSNRQIQFNDGGVFGASAAFTFNKASNLLTITGNLISANADLGNLATANYFTGNGYLLTSINGSNVTGQVANALVSGTVYGNTQPNITSLGTLTSLSVTGNTTSGNITATNITGTLATQAQPNITSVGTLISATISGNVTSGNANLGNLVTANYFSGNASLMTGIIANANYAAYAGNVTVAAQPLITSVGTLTSLAVNGLTTATGGVKTANIYDTAGTLTIQTKYNTYSGDVGITSNLTVGSSGTGNLVVNGTSDLGPVGNVKISGGSANYILATNGAGALSWVSPGSVSVTGTNTQVQFNDNGTFGADANFTYNKTTDTLGVKNILVEATGNITGGNLISANYFSGDGGYLSNIRAGNIVGQVANALVAGTVYGNVQSNITGLGTLSTLTVSGTITSGSGTGGTISGANSVSANYITGTYITGTFVTGSQPNLTSIGTLATLSVSGNITSGGNVLITSNVSAGNANLGNLASANFFSGNGYLLTGLNASNLASGTIPSSILGNSTVYVGTTAIALNRASGAQSLTGITSIDGYAATVSGAVQSNITSVGTLASLSVTANANVGNINATNGSLTGNLTISGNLVVGGSTDYINVTTVKISDPIIEQGGGANGAALSTNDGKDRGQLLHYYTTTPVDAFMGWDNSNGEFAFGSNVTIASDVITFNSFGNVRGNYFIGNGSLLTGITGTYSNANVASYLPTFAGNFTAGNISSSGNITAAYFVGNGSQLTGLPASYSNANVASYLPTYTGNFTAGNINATSNITAAYFVGNGSQLTGLPATYSNANVSAYLPTYTGNFTAGNMVISGNANIQGTLNATSVAGPASNVTISAGAFVSTFDQYGNITLSNNVTVTGNLTVNQKVNFTSASNVTLGAISNVHITGGTSGYVLQTDGSGTLSWVSPGSFSTSAAGANTQVQFNDSGTFGASSGFVFNKATNALSITGNLTSANANLGNLVTANYFTGNGSLLTYITGGNVTGQVANALVSGTVYSNAQPNITSLGTLTTLNVSGNVTSQYFIGDGSQLTGLPSSYSNANVASYLPTYTGNFTAGNISSSGNITAAYYIGNGSQLSSITGGNVTGQVANAVISGTVYANYQPNITGVGTLTTLNVTGNVTSGNIKSDHLLYANGDPYVFTTSAAGSNTQIQFNDNNSFAGNANLTYNKATKTLTVDNIVGNVVTGTQSNITTVGTLTELNVNGLVNLHGLGNITITGGAPGYVLTTNGSGGLTWSAAGGSGTSGFISIAKDLFTATGTSTDFILSTEPVSKNAIEVVIDGIQQLSNTYSLTGSTLSFPDYPYPGQSIEVTQYGVVDLTGSVGEVQFNNGGVFGSSSNLTFNTSSNTLTTGNITVTGNLTSQGGYVYVGAAMIAVSGGNAGVFNTGIGNLNIGLGSNVTIGSTSGNVTARGTFTAPDSFLGNTTVTNYISGRDAVTITTDTIIDQFPVNTYRSAKYTMRVNSDAGYQAVEVLLVHNGASSFVTIYGSISTIGSDIISLYSDIDSGNARLIASTLSTNTTVKVLGTYVPD